MNAARQRPALYAIPQPLRCRELWARELETMRAGFGVRAQTAHVLPGEWLGYWRRGREPFTALIHELRFIE